MQGRIVDLWGDPIPGAVASFHRLNFEKGQLVSAVGIHQMTTVSDGNGNYAFRGLPSGEYRVSVELRGFRKAEVWRFYLPAGGNEVLDIGLEVGVFTEWRRPEVSGTVLGTDNKPLKDATVTAISALSPNIVEQTRTGDDGRYRIELQTSGQFIVYASKPGFAVGAVCLPEGSGKSIELMLKPSKPPTSVPERKSR